MTRLIDADAFKKVLSEHEMKHDKRRSFNDYDWGSANAYEYAGDLLDEMPTIELPHGEWIDTTGNNDFVCSVCKHKAQIGCIEYCGNCGADMRRKEGEKK